MVFIKQVGITDRPSAMLKMSVSTSASWSAHDFRTLPWMRSGSGAFMELTCLTVHLTVTGVSSSGS